MKPIKIISDNREVIENILRAANGKASAHAITLFSELAEVTTKAEARLDRLEVLVADRVGARAS